MTRSSLPGHLRTLAVTGVLVLGGCALIPIDTAQNGTVLDGVHSARSGALIATYRTGWRVPPDCRNTLTETDLKTLADRNPVDYTRILAEVCRGKEGPVVPDPDFVALAVSGGGLKATTFTAEMLFGLEDQGILARTDVVSSVSGGTLAAALYAGSRGGDEACKPDTSNAATVAWCRDENGHLSQRTKDEVFRRIRDLSLLQFLGRSANPVTLTRSWLTHYDRSDIVAGMLATDLYGATGTFDWGLRMRDLNPARPALIINATQMARLTPAKAGVWWPWDGAHRIACAPGDRHGLKSAVNFGFTREQFECLGADLDDYPLATAVMASAAIPGLLSYVTLHDHKSGQHLHLLDGGVSDNLGLTGLSTALLHLDEERGDSQQPPPGKPLPSRVLVLQVQSSVGADGEDAASGDPRSPMDYLINTNALKIIDTFMFSGYERSELLIDKKLCDLTRRARRDLRLQLEAARTGGGRDWDRAILSRLPGGDDRLVTGDELLAFLRKLAFLEKGCEPISAALLEKANGTLADRVKDDPRLAPAAAGKARLSFTGAEIGKVAQFARRVPASFREKIGIAKVLTCNAEDVGVNDGLGLSPQDAGELIDLCEHYSRRNGTSLLEKLGALGGLGNTTLDGQQTMCVRAAAKLAGYLSLKKMCVADATKLAFGDLLDCSRVGDGWNERYRNELDEMFGNCLGQPDVELAKHP